ncbi:MAG: hypothetical protein JWN52_2281 [Actinomycetia bacterium]|jgi:hypothetical protein|nr:hypothetical protein [Actinomycetes bacterium]
MRRIATVVAGGVAAVVLAGGFTTPAHAGIPKPVSWDTSSSKKYPGVNQPGVSAKGTYVASGGRLYVEGKLNDTKPRDSNAAILIVNPMDNKGRTRGGGHGVFIAQGKKPVKVSLDATRVAHLDVVEGIIDAKGKFHLGKAKRLF